MRSVHPLLASLMVTAAVLSVGCGPSGPVDGVHREVLAAAHDGNQYVFVGERWNFEEPGPSRPILMTSPDAREFTVRDDDLPPVTLNSVAHGNGTFLAVGGQLFQKGEQSDSEENSIALFSTNGQTWSESAGIPETALRGVAFGNGVFVAVGADGSTYHSSTGETLTEGESISGLAFVTGIAFGAGKFVIYGDGPSVFVSDDGASFTKVAIPTDGARIDFVAGAFRGFGSKGASGEDPGSTWQIESTDALTWTDSPADTFIEGMAEQDGVFVGVSFSDILRSSNGTTWSSVRTFDEDHYRYDVIAAGGQFVVVGRNEITVSPDGQDFESLALP